MKIKLLSLFCVLGLLANAQAPINNYFSSPFSQYALVSGTVDESPTGANATWNFSGLTQVDTNTDTYAAPTAGELTLYPGTTQVLSITDGAMNASQIFYSVAGSTLSLTGASNPNFTIDYNTDNAEIGTYPLTFGAGTNTDNMAGTLTAQGQTVNYTGTIATDVDAYGSLSFDVAGLGAYTGNVTRVVTTQNISFFVAGIFPGTVTIMSNYYYKDSDGALVFRTTEGNITVAIAGINQDFSSAEGLITNTLSVEDNQVALNYIKLYPNPVENDLNIRLNHSIYLESVRINDINGKTVLVSKNGETVISTNQLQAGFYTITIVTNKGLTTRKFIKK